jgi:hypothetical protein
MYRNRFGNHVLVGIAAITAACGSRGGVTAASQRAEAYVVPVPAARPPVAPPPALPARLAAPLRAACIVSGSELTRPTPLRVALAHPFATATAVSAARAHLDGDAATVEIVASPLRIVARVAAKDVPLVAARPFVVAGVLVPGGATPLRLVEARADAVVVEMDVPAELDGAPRTARAAVACADLGLDAADLDFHALLGATKHEAQLPTAVKIPLSLDRASAPVVSLLFGADEDRTVDVLEPGKDRTRVAWRSAEDVVVTGWVATKELSPVDTSWAFGTAVVEATTHVASPALAEHAVVCAHEVPLVADRSGARMTIGTIEASARIAPLADEDGLVSIVVEAPGITLDPRARLYVRRADIGDCQPVP